MSEIRNAAQSFPDFARRFVNELDNLDPDDVRTYMEELSWIADALKVDVDEYINELEDTAREQEELAEQEEQEREQQRRLDSYGQKTSIEQLTQKLRNETRGEVTDREIESMFSSLT